MKRNRLLSIICLIIFLFSFRFIVLYLIEPIDYSIFFNHILKNRAAENNGKIDMVFIGASRTLRTFDPDVFEKELGLDCVFNAASGLQPIESGYYMLREIVTRYHPQYVVLGVTWDELLSDYNSTLAKVIVYDRLTGINKIKYLLNAFSPDEYLNCASLVYRFRDNLNTEIIRNNIQERKDAEENGYSERYAPPDLYKDNGFIYSFQTGDIPNYAQISYDPGKISSKKETYLEQIYALCVRNNIQLFLVSAPTTVMSLYRITDYQKAVDYYKNFAAEHDLSYVNLNYLLDREDWLEDDLMFDFNHVNGEGAELVSRKYAEFLKAEMQGKDTSDMFYTDLAEFQKQVHRIIAVGADISITDLRATVHINSRQTEGITPLYRVQFSTDDETYITLADWGTENDFIFNMEPYRGTVYFLIEAKSETGEPGCAIHYQREI